MKIEFDKETQIYIACGHTDMRRSIDGLSAMVAQNFNLDPFQNALFLFLWKEKGSIKSLILGRRWVHASL